MSDTNGVTTGRDRCLLCGGPVERPPRGGRPPKFCSTAHRVRYSRATRPGVKPAPGSQLEADVRHVQAMQRRKADPPPPTTRKRGAAAVAQALAGDGVVTMTPSFVPKPGAYVLAGCRRHPKAVADSEGRCQTCRLERSGSVRA